MISHEEKERTVEKLKDPALITDVVCYVSVGNSLIDLCNIWQVTYYVVSNYLYKNHKDEYEAALMTRGEWIEQRILDEIKSIGLVDIRQAYDEDGRMLDPKEWPDSLARAIAAVETTEEYGGKGDDRELTGYTKRLKMWDKLKALELLGKNRRMFLDKETDGQRLVVNVFNGLSQDKIGALPVEERISRIESALRSQNQLT